MKKFFKKVLIIIVALIIIQLSLYLYSRFIRVQESIVILPYNYMGPVFIVYGQKDGVEPKIEDNYRVYEIDSSGILKTKNNRYSINYKEYYYYRKNNNKLIPLQYVYGNGNDYLSPRIEQLDKNSTKNFVIGEESMGLSDGSDVRMFVVSNLQNLDSICFLQMNKSFKLDSIVKYKK